jgi:hypothetical protein
MLVLDVLSKLVVSSSCTQFAAVVTRKVLSFDNLTTSPWNLAWFDVP